MLLMDKKRMSENKTFNLKAEKRTISEIPTQMKIIDTLNALDADEEAENSPTKREFRRFMTCNNSVMSRF